MADEFKEANCIACGGKNILLKYPQCSDKYFPNIPGTFDLYECARCKLLFIWPQPAQQTLNEHYPEEYEVYDQRPKTPSKIRAYIIGKVAKQYLGYGRKTLLGNIWYPFYLKLAHLPQSKNAGVILDVGCSGGARFPVFELLGWRVEGVELDAKAAEAARTFGYKVVNASFNEALLKKDSYDVVHMNNVFEHFLDPVGVLNKSKDILKQNGELLLVVPNGSSINARIFRKYWFGLEIPRHTYTYNRKNISLLLTQHGFKVEKIISSNTFGTISSSLSYVLGISPHRLSFLDRVMWTINIIADPLFVKFNCGDFITIRAVVQK